MTDIKAVIQVYIDKETSSNLKRVAKIENRSASAQASRFIKEGLERKLEE